MRILVVVLLCGLAGAAPAAAQVCVLSLSGQPAQQRVVHDFADSLFQKRQAMGQNLLSAIDNFETTMQFASGFEAEPQVARALMKSALKQSTDYLVGLVDKEVPGTKQVVAGIQAIDAELERAAAAQSSHDVGAWIRTQRTLVSNRMTGANEGDLPTSVAIREAILEELCWLNEEGGDLDAAIEAIAEAHGSLGDVPSEESYRRGLFEDWIRANHASIGGKERASGTVHVHWEVDVDGSPSDHGSGPYPLEWGDGGAVVVLPSPYGQRVAGGLGELGVGPLAARVVKKVCFETDGIAGGTATYCGTLRADGTTSSEPDPPWARQAFEDPTWRERTTWSSD